MKRKMILWFCTLALNPLLTFAADPPEADPPENESGLPKRTLDQIWLAPPKPNSKTSDWYPQPVQTHQVDVIEFDAKQLTYAVMQSDDRVTVAADRVLWIEPAEVTSDQKAMIRLFETGEFGKSLSYLPEVLKTHPPVWRQQWLSMMASDSAYRSGRVKIALDLLDQLDRRPLPPMVIAWLPVQWNGGAATASVQEEAGNRINDQSPLVQLVAASWILSSPNRSVAISTLQRLTRNRDRPSVARLAQVLLWTTKPPKPKSSNRNPSG